ncbi:hypothetical protein [Anaeromicrobium sediminis]|nr:hypothetical protein [Anaeromicrobium sediminis]
MRCSRRIIGNVPYGSVSDLIYCNEYNLTAEQIVDKALSYKPIQL